MTEPYDPSLEVFQRSEHHDVFARMRAEDPVHHHVDEDGFNYWCLTKHADVQMANRDIETFEAGMVASAEMLTYANKLRAERLIEPRDDIVTKLTNAEIDAERLTEAEFGMFVLVLVLVLVVAGNETTRNATTHGMRALIEHPEQLDQLRADPSRQRIERAVEEILRWSTPVLYFRRTATRDVELRGKTIKAGDRVALWYASANRDEEAFSEPFTFDLDRWPNDHVTFGGGGPHFCLGANLARMELRLIFTELVTRMTDLELTGPVEMIRSNFVAGVSAMPIRWTSLT